LSSNATRSIGKKALGSDVVPVEIAKNYPLLKRSRVAHNQEIEWHKSWKSGTQRSGVDKSVVKTYAPAGTLPSGSFWQSFALVGWPAQHQANSEASKSP
jgi:hypothetical protein